MHRFPPFSLFRRYVSTRSKRRKKKHTTLQLPACLRPARIIGRGLCTKINFFCVLCSLRLSVISILAISVEMDSDITREFRGRKGQEKKCSTDREASWYVTVRRIRCLVLFFGFVSSWNIGFVSSLVEQKIRLLVFGGTGPSSEREA